MPFPSYYADTDIPGMMADFGVPVTAGASSGLGIVDMADESVLQTLNVAGVKGKNIMVTVQTSLFGGVAIGAAITIDGAPFKLRDRAQQGDGSLTQWWCQA